MNKKQLKKKYVNIFKIVKEQLDLFDAYNLLAEGCPKDEFEQEAMLISNKITKHTTINDLSKIIASVYSEQFNDVFTADDFLPYAENILKKISEENIIL